MTIGVAGWAAIVSAAAGAGVHMYSSRQQGKAANAAAQLQAQQLNKQSQLEAARAGLAQEQGEIEANKRSRALAQEIGSIYADFAGNGVDISSGGTIDKALTTAATSGAADLRVLERNTRLNAMTHLANAESYGNDALTSLFNGKNSLSSGNLGAWGYGLKVLGDTIQAGSA